MSCTSNDPCNQPQYSSDAISYVGPNLICTTIETCDSVTEAFQKANLKICNLQNTLVALQNQLSSLTTTTSTTSTSTSTTTSTSSSTTTTTTISNPIYYVVPKTRINSGSQGLIRMIFRINGGAWTTFTSTLAPSGNFYIGGGSYPPLSYSTIGASIGNSMNFAPNVGDLVELYFVKDSTLENLVFGVNFNATFSSPTFTPAPGAVSTGYCGPTNPYAFYYNKISRFFNINSTGDDSTWATNTLVTC